MKIAFIGAGSMAEAMINGFIDKQLVKNKDIFVTNQSDKQKLLKLKNTYGVQITYDLDELFHETEIVVFAVKPKDAEEALLKIKPFVKKTTLFISVLAGVSISYIQNILAKDCPIVRAMPNTSATIGKSATGLAFNDHVSKEAQNRTLSLFTAIGSASIVKEDQLDIVTGLSGSGPAYIYYVVEALEQSAVDYGLEKEEAKALVIQTLLGATHMLSQSNATAKDLRQAVTSPGGTTEAGVRILEQYRVKEAFIACVKEATQKSKKLGHVFEKA